MAYIFTFVALAKCIASHVRVQVGNKNNDIMLKAILPDKRHYDDHRYHCNEYCSHDNGRSHRNSNGQHQYAVIIQYTNSTWRCCVACSDHNYILKNVYMHQKWFSLVLF